MSVVSPHERGSLKSILSRRGWIVVSLLVVGILVAVAAIAYKPPEAKKTIPNVVKNEAKVKPPLASNVIAGIVSGKLTPEKKQRAVGAVSELVDKWLDLGFTAESYPRNNFAEVLPMFDPSVRAKAKRDLTLLTNAKLGPNLAGVRAIQRRIKVDLLAVDGEVRGATARVRFAFVATGKNDERSREELSGRLLLAKNKTGWRIFGYNVLRGGR
jgi:hypothetical protein